MTDWNSWVRERLDLGDLTDTHAADVVEEIGQLLEDHYTHLINSGANAAEAEAAAREHIDNWEDLRADVARARRSRRKTAGKRIVEGVEAKSLGKGEHWASFSNTLKDVHMAGRALRRSPASSLVMILTLALGIGATTAIYSVVEAVVLRPLPYPEADRLGLITFTGQGMNDSISITPSQTIDFAEQARSLSTLGTYRSFTNTLELDDGSVVFVPIAIIEPQIQRLLGISPSRGRLLEPVIAGETDGSTSEAMISEELWERHFAAHPDILGREIDVAGGSGPAVIVGIVPRGTRFLVHPQGERERIDVWLSRAAVTRRGNVFSQRAMAQLAEGFTFEAASAELNSIAERNRARDFENEDGRGVLAVVPLRDRLVKAVRPNLYLLLGAVGFVLLLVCVNVANLMLVRSLRRRQEWALRAALGASRSRIVRLGLTESLVLAALGGVLGIAVAAGCLRLLPLVTPDTLPRGAEIGINVTVLAFAAAISLATSLMFGLVPAWNASKIDLRDSLIEGTRIVSGAGRVSRALITVQFALALVLVVGAGLMLRTIVNLNSVDVGFDADGLLTFQVLPSVSMFEEPATRLQFYREATARLEALPGVESASWTNLVPLSGGFNSASWAYDEETVERFGELTAYFRRAMPGYFQTLGMPLLMGRDFNDDDVDNDRYVLIVSERMAEMAWPGESPIGKRVTIDFRTASGMTELRETEVIGVAPSSREVTLHGDEPPLAYLPAWSTRAVNRAVVRTAGEPMELLPLVRALVKDLGVRRPLDNTRTVRRNIQDATADTRFILILTGVFSALAVLLAGLGVYGVLSHLVGQRRHEIGVRMALGASRRSVRSMMMRQGLAVVAIGLGIGLVLALGLTRVIESMLYGVSATDPATFVSVGALLFAVAAVACLIPATRATRVEPVTALREE